MPSGPKKRHAARRRSMGGRPGTGTSPDMASVSDSHVSDEGTSPKTSDDKKIMLSLSSGINEKPADQTFHTEEWVRVSDFDVGTPTSTTVKSDFDAQDSFGDVRVHDKLIDWETVSRENPANSYSALEVGEADHFTAKESASGQKQVQKLPHVDVVLSCSDSEKEDDDKSGSSGSVGGKSPCSMTSSNRSAGSRSDAYPENWDEERSRSIVVVPSYREHEEDSQESSYAEVASVEVGEDDYHRIVATVSSSEEVNYQASSAIEPASSEEQEEGSFELVFGVEDYANNAIEPASSEEQEEEKYGPFTDLPKTTNFVEDMESGTNAVDLTALIRPESGGESSSNECVVVGTALHLLEAERAGSEEPKIMEEKHQTTGNLKTQNDQMSELTQMTPKTLAVNESSEVTDFVTSESCAQGLLGICPPEQINEDGLAAEETLHVIEPPIPEGTLQKSFIETPCTFVRSVSDKEILDATKVSLLEVEQTAPTLSLSEANGVEENVAKEVHDTTFSSGLPEPCQEELKQLIEIAPFKKIAVLEIQEANFLAQEEQEFGKGIVDLEPLIEVIPATVLSKLLKGGKLKGLQSVTVEEPPVLKESSSVVSDLDNVVELNYREPELFTKKSGEELLEGSWCGVRDEYQTADDPVSGDLSLQTKLPLAENYKGLEAKAGSDSFLAIDYLRSVKSEELSTKNVRGICATHNSEWLECSDSEWLKCSAESITLVEATFEGKSVDRTGNFAGSSEKLEKVTYQRREDLPRTLRPIQVSSDVWGCCEHVQWLFANFRQWVNPRSI